MTGRTGGAANGPPSIGHLAREPRGPVHAIGPGSARRDAAAYHVEMDLASAPVLAAKVWHYWIAVPLAAGGVLLLVATVAGYLKKVQSLKYPRGGAGE